MSSGCRVATPAPAQSTRHVIVVACLLSLPALARGYTGSGTSGTARVDEVDEVTPARSSCAVIDISAGTTTLPAAQLLARAAGRAASCVTVLLGRRSFRLAAPLVLTAADSHTSYVGQGAEITAALDVPRGAWRTNASHGGCHGSDDGSASAVMTLNASQFFNDTAWGSLLSGSNLAVLVYMHGEWRPLTVARWPNIPFDYGTELPFNWTSIAAVPNATCGTECREFVWAKETDRPSRWVLAAAEGRLHIHGFFR